MARVVLAAANILGGLAVIENRFDRTCPVEAVPAAVLPERDAQILTIAKEHMPALPFDCMDVLVVDEMSKNISGGGMDYNVVGWYFTEGMTGGPVITKLGVLNITEESHGNGIGMGLADFITHRLRDKLDFEAAYVNALTAAVTKSCSVPLAIAADRDLFKAAVKTRYAPDADTEHAQDALSASFPGACVGGAGERVQDYGRPGTHTVFPVRRTADQEPVAGRGRGVIGRPGAGGLT